MARRARLDRTKAQPPMAHRMGIPQFLKAVSGSENAFHFVPPSKALMEAVLDLYIPWSYFCAGLFNTPTKSGSPVLETMA